MREELPVEVGSIPRHGVTRDRTDQRIEGIDRRQTERQGKDRGEPGEGGEPGEAQQVSRTIEIVMHDNYFEPEQLSFAAGETVRLKVRNEGALVHEFNIGTAAMHEAHQGQMQMMVDHGVIQGDHLNHERMKMDMGGGHTMEHSHANSLLLEPGQEAELVWTFASADSLEFACNVPGHYQAGMYGEVNFE